VRGKKGVLRSGENGNEGFEIGGQKRCEQDEDEELSTIRR